MKNFLFIIIIPLLSAFFVNTAIGQSWPAGVGNQNGTSGQPANVLWLNAEDISVSNGEDVETWSDLSGNGNDASMSSNYKPSFSASGLNGQPALYFDGTEYLVIGQPASLDFTPGTDNFSVIAVYHSEGDGTIFSKGYSTTNQRQYQFYTWNTSLQTRIGGTNSDGGSNNINSDHMFAFTVNTTNVNSWVDGSSEINNGSVGSATNSVDVIVGARRNGSDNSGYGFPFEGQIAEIIVYADEISEAQRIIIENYLGAKYGISIANDHYAGNSPYTNDLIGIGTNGTTKHSTTSSSSESLYISESGSSLNAVDEYLLAAHNGELNGMTNDDVDAGLASGRLNRIWYVDKTGTIDATLSFNLVESGFSTPTDPNDYVLLYRAGTSGDFTEVTATETINGDNIEYSVTDANLQDGYYTLGVPRSRDWYTLVTGDWDDHQIWTLDPAGALPNNPDNYTPSTSPTAEYDNVHILSGKPVTISTDNKANGSVEVLGELILGTTTGHFFNTIQGTGRIIMQADNFPAGDATHFVTEGMGEGTAVFEGTSYTISNAREFYDVEINLDNSTDKIILTNNLTVNGDFSVQTGEFQINDNAGTTVLDLFVNKDVTVQANGKILVGTGDTYTTQSQYHQFTVQGDFTNYGTVKLTNRAAADYNNDDNGGAVELIFNNTAANQNLQCDNTSVFNQITIDKGNDETYILKIAATNAAYFKLYGRNNQEISGDSGERDGNKALRLLAGTLKLDLNIEIPNLADNYSYDIDADARLWINDATVTMPNGATNNWIAVYGKLQISANSVFTEETDYGTLLREEGTIKIEGGTVNFNAVRTSTWDASGDHVGSYVQTGGDVTVNEESSNGDYATFHLPYETNVFQMSGGTLTIIDQQNGGDADDFALIINSAQGNYNVTGGTVIIDMHENVPYLMTSRAPFYNFIIRNSVDTDQTLTITNFDETGSPQDVPDVEALPLVVLNDLTIEQYCTLDANGQNLEIVGDFNVNDGGTYTHGNGTLKFFGDHNGSRINIGDNTSEPGLTIYNLVIEKDQNYNDWVLDDIDLISSGRANNTTALLIENDVLITRGEFDVRSLNVELQGNMEIVDGNVLYNATTPGYIVLNGSTQQTLKGSFVDEQDFGNLELYNTAGVEILSHINVHNFNIKTDLTVTEGVVYLNTYNLYATGDLTTSGTFSDNTLFATAGNGGDGGISTDIDFSSGIQGTEHLVPIGTAIDPTATPVSFQYSPVTITQDLTINDTVIYTIKPVNDYHPSYLGGNPNQTVAYYWNIWADDTSSYSRSDVKYTCIVPFEAHSAANNGAWLDYSIYEWDEENSIVNASGGTTTITFPYRASINGDFTVGNKSIFKDPEVFYTRDYQEQPDWHDGNTWTEQSILIDANGDGTIDSKDWHDSRQPDAGSAGGGVGDYPEAGDIAVIGWVPWDDPNTARRGYPHSARWNDNNKDVECAQIIFTQMLDASGNPTERVYRNNFQFRPTFTINSTGNMNVAKISGEGTIRVRDASNIDPDFSDIDIGDFASQDSSYFLYEAFTDKTYNNAPSIYPNLFISNDGWGANDRDVTINKDITVFGNFEVRGNANYLLPTGSDGDIEVYGDLIIDQDPVGTGGAEFAFGNTGTERSVYVRGSIYLQGDGCKIWVRNPENTDLVDHNLYVEGNITQNTSGTNDIMRFWTADDEDRITLHFVGDENADFIHTAGDIPEFYRLVMNKVAGNQMHIQSDFNLNGPTNSDPKAIELLTGDLFLDHSDININLNTGGPADFEIPTGTSFQIKRGIVNVSGNNTGIWLDDKLTIGYQGQLLCNGGTNNYIEYTASGNAEIYIEQGTLRVGSQIRRAMDADEGILSFTQNKQNSTIVIGEDGTAPENDRGIFELTNDQCSFTQSQANSTITIACQQANPQVPSLFFKDLLDANVSIADGSSFIIGGSTTPINQTIGIYSNVNLKNIEVDNSSSNDPTAKMWTVPLTLEENLTIGSDAGFDANGLALNIAGDMTNDGNFSANGNTTTFNGSAVQNITGTGTTTFYNLTKSTATSLTLGKDIIVDNVFDMATGTLNDGDNTLTVKGNINFGGTHTWGGTSDGINLNGTIEQMMTGAGTYGKLTINNTNGVTIDPGTGSDIVVSGELELINGIFDIDVRLLSLQSGADITTPSTFSANRMIQTNMSFTDKGIQKYFPAIASPTDFTYPIGCQGKYTPFVLSINTIDAGGNIRIAAANEIQPTIQNDSDECDDFEDKKNVLQYHWVVKASSVSNFDAETYFKYDPADAWTDNTFGYDTSDYIPARLKTFGDNTWNKYDFDDFDGLNQKIHFTFNGTDDNGISGEYTAGIEQPSGAGCSGGAIPNIVSQYISIANGDWETITTWDTYPAAGGDIPVGGPSGAIVIIDENDEVTVPNNYIHCYKTEIRSGGILNLGTTFGHRLGIVSGTGTLYLERGELPAADYEEFFSASGGTLNYGGTTDYYILPDINELNNLTLSGTGTLAARRFPNADITILGDFTIDGPRVYNYNDKSMTIMGDISKISGYCRIGYGGSRSEVILSGTEDQTIAGDIKNVIQSFKHLTINKSAGSVLIDGNLQLNGDLTLQNGIVYTASDKMIYLSEASSASGTSNSYIEGPLFKDLYGNENFTFPVGKSSYYRPIAISDNGNVRAEWTAEYFPTNSFSDMGANLLQVSAYDFWSLNADKISGTGSPTAESLTLSWGPKTNVADGFETDIVVAELDGSNVWQTRGGQGHTGNYQNGTVTSDQSISFSQKFFTIGSKTDDNPLPVELIAFNAQANNDIVDITWKTSSEINNDFFTVEKTTDGIVYHEVGIVQGAGNSNIMKSYALSDNKPFAGISYYRLKQTDYDGKFEYSDLVPVFIAETKESIEVDFSAYPNPVQNGNLNLLFKTVNADNEQLTSIKIIDAMGKLFMDKAISNKITDQTVIRLNVRHLPPGLYVVITEFENYRKFKKIIIQ